MLISTLLLLCFVLPSADEVPPYRRVLTEADQEKADKFESQLIELTSVDKYPEAIKVAEQLLELCARVQGAEHHEVVTQRFRLESLRKLGAATPAQRAEWAEAMRAASAAAAAKGPGAGARTVAAMQKLCTLSDTLLGPRHPDTASIHTQLGHALDDLGKHAEAETELRKALDIYQKSYGDQHPETAICRNSLASTVQARRNFDGAEALYRSARATLEQTLGPEHPYTITTMNNLGSNLYARGKYKEAEGVHREVLAIRLKLFGEEDANTVMSHGNVAACLNGQGQYTEAEPLYRKALALSRKVHGEEHGQTARYYHGLAEVLSKQDRFAEALPLYRQQLAISRKVFGEDHHMTARALSGMGFILDRQGQYAEAAPLFRQALTINQKVFGEKHSDTARGYNNLAHNLENQGHELEAEAYFRRALAIWREVSGEHRDTATAADNLANNLLSQGRFDDSEQLTREALAMRQKVQGADHHDTVHTARILGYLLVLRGKPKEGEELLRTALKHFEEKLGPRHAETASSYNYLAIALERQGRLADAELLLRRALGVFELTLGEHQQDTANSRANLGHNLLAQGKDEEAVVCYQQALRSFEAARLCASPRGLERSVFADKAGGSDPSRRLVVTLARLGRAREAWQTFEAHLGRGLLDDYSARRQLRLPAAEQQQLDGIRAKLAVLEKQIEEVLNRQEPTADAEKHLAELVRQRTEVQDQQIRLAAELGQRSVYPLEQIQQHLPADAACVAWLDRRMRDSDGKYVNEHWAFVLKGRDEPLVIRLAGSGAAGAWTPEDEDLPHQARTAVIKRADPANVRGLLGRLEAQRLIPLAPQLAGIRHLIILSSQELAGLPLEAVTDRYQITYAPSGTLLTRLIEARTGRPEQRATPRSLLALGDPVLQQAGGKPAEPLEGARRGAGWAPLPGTRKEVEAIAALFPKAQKLLGADASKNRLTQLEKDLSGFDVIHLATHGQTDPTVAFNASLILSPSPGDEGRLTAFDIRDRWNLQADLVVLSACESGLGRYAGGEGYLGFSQALFLAGAHSIVLSQWPVSDTATSLLMVRFYENWLGARGDKPQSKAVALQEAKRWLRNMTRTEVEARIAKLPETARGLKLESQSATPLAADDKPFAHPYYWSAFILIGDPS